MKGWVRSKELTLINPRCGNFIVRNIVAMIEQPAIPLSLSTIAALTPPTYNIGILNHKIFWWPWDFLRKGLVAITCYSANAHIAYSLADRYRKKGACVIMGGPHVSALPQEALQHCDSVIIGEVESVWRDILKDFEDGKLKEEYRGIALDDFFSPVHEYFLRLKPRQIFFSGIQTTRGCKYHCEFCASSVASYRTIQQEQVLSLVNKVKSWARIVPLYFKDDNIYSDPVYARSLFRKLIPFRIKWFSSSSLDVAFDDEALRLAKESGCVQLAIGFETLHPEKLPKTSVNQKVRSTKDLLMLIKKIKSYGISVRGAFILGLDESTHRDYWRLLTFFMRARLHYIALGILTPFPGSRLYRRLEREERVLSRDWRKFDCLHVVFRPKNMSALSVQLWFVFLRTAGFLCAQQTGLVFLFILIYFFIIFPILIR